MKFTITLPDLPKVQLPKLRGKRCGSYTELLDVAVSNFKLEPSEENEQSLLRIMAHYKEERTLEISKGTK